MSVALITNVPFTAVNRTLDMMERAFFEATISWAISISRAIVAFSQLNFIDAPVNLKNNSRLIYRS
jgi:hypothetical protein